MQAPHASDIPSVCTPGQQLEIRNRKMSTLWTVHKQKWRGYVRPPTAASRNVTVSIRNATVPICNMVTCKWQKNRVLSLLTGLHSKLNGALTG